MRQIEVGKKYRHFKGFIVDILLVAKDSYVIYYLVWIYQKKWLYINMKELMKYGLARFQCF